MKWEKKLIRRSTTWQYCKSQYFWGHYRIVSGPETPVNIAYCTFNHGFTDLLLLCVFGKVRISLRCRYTGMVRLSFVKSSQMKANVKRHCYESSHLHYSNEMFNIHELIFIFIKIHSLFTLGNHSKETCLFSDNLKVFH